LFWPNYIIIFFEFNQLLFNIFVNSLDKQLVIVIALKLLRLHCHKNSCKAGIRGELGRFPLQIKILVKGLKFLNHILQQNEDSLVFKALTDQKKINSKSSWFSNIAQICKTANININFNCENNESIMKKIHSIFQSLYEKQWKIHLKTNKKLSPTYSKIKTTICYESYLDDIKCIKQKKCFTYFRISSHNLHIERDRYFNIEKNERKCLHCDEIEDEIHLLSPENKFIYMMTAEDNICKMVTKFCYESFNERDSLT